MLLLTHSVGRKGYLQRCLPPAALMEVAQRWDGLIVHTAQRGPGHARADGVCQGGSAFIASVAVSAAQPGAVGRYATRRVDVAPAHVSHCQRTAAAIRHTASVDCQLRPP